MNATVRSRAEMWMISALLLLLAAGCSQTRVAAPALPQPDSVWSAQVAPGVVHTYRWYASGPFAIHTLTVEPNTCGLAFRAIKGGDARVGRETTSALAQRADSALPGTVLAAINADFFLFDPPGVSVGPQVSNGQLLKSQEARRHTRPVFAITREGKPQVTHAALVGEVRIGGRSVPLAGVNVVARGDSGFVFTRFWGDATPVDSAATEVTVRGGVVATVDTLPDGVAIPEDGAVIVLKGSARNALPGITAGTAAHWRAELEGLEGAREVLAGYPLMLRNGKAVHQDEPGLTPAFAERRHPRSAIGFDRAGRIYLVTVDGRQPGYSDGMSLQELGDFLTAHGITDALNFDGGGSTTLVVRGRIVNRPSDSNGERAVANALLLVDQGEAEGCARKP